MYVMKHKKNKVYLKYFKRDKFKHYVADINDATFFKERKEVKAILKTYKHPENWDILKIEFKTKK